MNFSKPVSEIIKSRYSIRTYMDKPLEENIRTGLVDFINNNKTCPFDSLARFELISATAEDRNELKGLGTYGMIKDVNAFIVGAVKKSPKNLEDYGYLMEKIVLFVTDLGLGSCWLGGTFNKSNFAGKIKIEKDEIIPAVLAVGYKSEKEKIIDPVIRWGAGSKRRKSWESLFFIENIDTPLISENIGKYEIPLEMVRRAPSASNNQPWRIIKNKDKHIYNFFLERTKGYKTRNKILFKMADMQRIDMGIAMSHFELSAKELNLKGEWKIRNDLGGILSRKIEYIASWIG